MTTGRINQVAIVKASPLPGRRGGARAAGGHQQTWRLPSISDLSVVMPKAKLRGTRPFPRVPLARLHLPRSPTAKRETRRPRRDGGRTFFSRETPYAVSWTGAAGDLGRLTKPRPFSRMCTHNDSHRVAVQHPLAAPPSPRGGTDFKR